MKYTGWCQNDVNVRGYCQAAGIVWSTYLDKFIVTLGCGKVSVITSTAHRKHTVRAAGYITNSARLRQGVQMGDVRRPDHVVGVTAGESVIKIVLIFI
jgi:hypothetical protein